MMKLPWRYIALSFTIGLLGGASLSVYTLHGLRYRWMTAERRHAWILKRLNSKLNLSQEQTLQVDIVLKSNHQKMEALQAEVRPKIESIRNATFTEVRKLLTSSQQTRFDQWHAKWEARHRKYPSMHSWGG